VINMAQGDILKLLKKHREMTVKEISHSININIYSVYENLRRLRRQGWVELKRGKVRLLRSIR